MKIATGRRYLLPVTKLLVFFRLFREFFFGCFCAFPCFSFSSPPFLPFGRGCIVSAFSPLPSPRGPFCFRHSSLAFIGEEGNGRCREERRERWQSEVREKPSSSSSSVCVCHTAAAKREEEEKEEKCIGGEESRQGNKVGRGEKKEEEKGFFWIRQRKRLFPCFFLHFFFSFCKHALYRCAIGATYVHTWCGSLCLLEKVAGSRQKTRPRVKSHQSVTFRP